MGMMQGEPLGPSRKWFFTYFSANTAKISKFPPPELVVVRPG